MERPDFRGGAAGWCSSTDRYDRFFLMSIVPPVNNAFVCEVTRDKITGARYTDCRFVFGHKGKFDPETAVSNQMMNETSLESTIKDLGLYPLSLVLIFLGFLLLRVVVYLPCRGL